MHIKTPGTINIGCFGAIRNMKNHVNQALAAIKTADYNGLTLHFHINGTRAEGPGAESILKNLRSIFNGTKHQLIEHAWLTHDDFLELFKKIDILTQVSFSETFNVVCADAVVSRVPVVASAQVNWLHNTYSRVPNPNDLVDIFMSINQILYLEKDKYHKLLNQQLEQLRKYNNKSEEIWLNWIFKGQEDNY